MTNVDTDTTHQTMTAQRGHVQALAFARLGGTALSNLLGTIATRKEAERQGPIDMLLFLDTHYTDDEAVMIPVVGSKKVEGTNLPYDKYSQKVQTKDGEKMVPGSWFTDVIRATDEYAAIMLRRSFCQDITFVGDNGETCPDEIANMGTGERATEAKRLGDRVRDMRTALTKGAMLFHHAATIRELNPDRISVKMPIRSRKNTDGSEYQEVYGNTIRLIDPAKEIEDKVLTVSEFNALRPAKLPTVPSKDDPSKLDKTGWTTTALEKTKERGAKGAGKTGKGKQEIATPTTVEGVLNMMNILGTALDVETDQGMKTNALLLTALASKGKDGDDKVITVGDFCLKTDTLWTTINARYLALKSISAAALSDAAKAQADAQAARRASIMK